MFARLSAGVKSTPGGFSAPLYVPAIGPCAEKLRTDGSGIKKIHELKLDLVLLDLAMPDINGLEAARMMSGFDPTVPIILFTAVDGDGLENAARNAGIHREHNHKVDLVTYPPFLPYPR